MKVWLSVWSSNFEEVVPETFKLANELNFAAKPARCMNRAGLTA
jgi:hypothetical protein